MNARSDWQRDVEFHYSVANRRVPNVIIQSLNPSLVAAAMFRQTAQSTGIVHVLLRWTCLVLFSSDIAGGVTINGAIDLPHPSGIVLGRNVVIGDKVRIFQHVTLGSSRKGEYPEICDGVTIYPGVVIAGGLKVGEGVTVGANCVVVRSVAADTIVRK